MPKLITTAVARPNPRMLAEVAAGLSGPQKELPPKYFYDHRGSELFEEITRLPEYYLTRAERLLLEQWMPHLVRSLGSRTLVELGAGSAEKSRIILNAMRAAGTAGAIRADRCQRGISAANSRADPC
jgi:L-histidine N-alpha-methyltransferase